MKNRHVQSIYMDDKLYAKLTEAHEQWLIETDLPKGITISFGVYLKMLLVKSLE